jgi:hypothetical protein
MSRTRIILQRFLERLVLPRYFFISVFLCFLSTTATSQATAAQDPAPAPQVASQASSSAASPSFDQVIDRMTEREHLFLAQMRHLHPLVETYIQNLKGIEDKAVPVSDQYFLGRLDMTKGTQDRSFMGEPGFGRRFVSTLTGLYGMKFLPLGFAQMVVLDDDFQRRFYKFTFVRREFLGAVRCLVIDVEPIDKSAKGRFVGRIWVEDQDYNVVRFNGTYSGRERYSYYLHFDSWRINMRAGLWLPAYIYSEESDLLYRGGHRLHFKAQTRLWGYDLHQTGQNEEFSQIVVDAPQQAVNDQSASAQDATPVESQRHWESEAEQNAVERLEKVGLLAPEGDVDKVLQTVVNNLIVTNNLTIEPEVRTRVLLTSPLESFTIGHVIVVSRGLLDVLPDEASLAMVLAHELSHIALGHRLDTKFAFNDRMLFPDENTFQQLDFARDSADEEAADQKALELLAKSPYKDKLGNAGLFLKVLQEHAPELKSLIRPHLGNGLAGKSTRMSALLTSAPQLQPERTDQIAALPLGGRIRVDPWSNRVELVKTKPVAILTSSEKMPFEVTPFYPYLTRLSGGSSEKTGETGPAN